MLNVASEGSWNGKYYELSGTDVFSIPEADVPPGCTRADLQVISVGGTGIAYNRTGINLIEISPKIKELRAKDGTSIRLTRADIFNFRAKSLDGSLVGFRVEFRSSRIIKS